MHPKPRIAAMTCTSCTDTDFVVAAKPGFVSRLLAAFGPFRTISRLEVEGLSLHRLRDLGLADGRAAAPRDRMWD
jgi:hypothetical protein